METVLLSAAAQVTEAAWSYTEKYFNASSSADKTILLSSKTPCSTGDMGNTVEEAFKCRLFLPAQVTTMYKNEGMGIVKCEGVKYKMHHKINSQILFFGMFLVFV